MIMWQSPRFASAANLKFLSVSRQVLDRNFKFKAALESVRYWSSFDSSVRIGGRRDSLRTLESELQSREEKRPPAMSAAGQKKGIFGQVQAETGQARRLQISPFLN
jgi:hypothetical protein